MRSQNQKVFEEHVLDLIAYGISRDDTVPWISINMHVVGNPFGQVTISYIVTLVGEFTAMGDSPEEALQRAKERYKEDITSTRDVEVPRSVVDAHVGDLDDEIPY